MEVYKEQERDLIYALDIGTRGIVGVVGRTEGSRFKVLDMEMAEHDRRTMIDGQIDNIRQVGALARAVTDRLADRLGVRLERVCVAAAGRALQTEKGTFVLERTGSGKIEPEEIRRLETGAVSDAEEHLQSDDEERRQFFLVGYTVSQYRLDHYPLNSLLDHTGKVLEADAVATFLPGEVVESLYAAMEQAGLEVASLTLEPIAAMNAAIPQDLRLLNLALVDIGAGTTDIAICRDGSVVGYTMTTTAGDEITEEIMRGYLVDFQVAEGMKKSLGRTEEIPYKDVLGFENTCTAEELMTTIKGPMELLAQAITEQILALNTKAPSAVFLAGGGSHLSGLRECVAQKLGMDIKRVSTAGNNYEKTMFSEELELNDPEYATPLGIAISAGLGLLNDSYMVMLNGSAAKLFRSGVLTLRDVLLMNGYTYFDMLARTGKSFNVTVDGRRITIKGEPGTPAVLKLNGEEASLSHTVTAGDRIDFTPAVPGKDGAATVESVLDGLDVIALVNGLEVPMDTPLEQGDVVETMDRPAVHPVDRPAVQPSAAEAPQPKPVPQAAEESLPRQQIHSIDVMLNGKPLHLSGKTADMHYYLMDLLEKTDIDFEHVDRAVRLKVNGVDSGFSQVLSSGDYVDIYEEDAAE